MFGRGGTNCQQCGTKTVKAPFAEIHHPFKKNGGQLDTQEFDACPNTSCSRFYKTVDITDEDLGQWVWADRIKR